MNHLSMHLLAYKLGALAIGGLSLFWGYRLFQVEISAQEQLASIEANHGLWGLELEHAAPGIFFALFGAAIVTSVVLKGMTLKAEAAEAVAPRSTPASARSDGSSTELGRLYIGSDLKKIVSYKLEQVWGRVQESSLSGDDRLFVQMRLAEIGADLDRASRGELITEKQPSVRATNEESPKAASTRFQGYGSAPPD